MVRDQGGEDAYGFDVKDWRPGEPRLERSLTLQFVGDWGQANFHRICSWLCQDFCDRAGPRSRVAIWNTVEGGIDAMRRVHAGEADMAIMTPAHSLPAALTGAGIFGGDAMPSLRALAVLPQRDRMVLALPRALGIATFAELREKMPPLTIATGEDNGFNLIGYVARRYMEAHGIGEEVLRGWGGRYVESARPDLSLARFRDGTADAVLQEAIMTPWWRDAVTARDAVLLPAEPEALARLDAEHAYPSAEIAAEFFPGQPDPVRVLDFSDFVIVIRDDMPEDVAHLLTWILVEKRATIERQFSHIPPDRSPLSYPLVPEAMARPSLPLHPGARRYYHEAGIPIGD